MTIPFNDGLGSNDEKLVARFATVATPPQPVLILLGWAETEEYGAPFEPPVEVIAAMEELAAWRNALLGRDVRRDLAKAAMKEPI